MENQVRQPLVDDNTDDGLVILSCWGWAKDFSAYFSIASPDPGKGGDHFQITL